MGRVRGCSWAFKQPCTCRSLSLFGRPTCSDPPETQLGSAEQLKLLDAAAGLDSAAQQAGAQSATTGRTWPYKGPQQGRSSRGGSRPGGGSSGSGAKGRAGGAWRPYVPWGKLAVLLALLAGAVQRGRPAGY